MKRRGEHWNILGALVLAVVCGLILRRMREVGWIADKGFLEHVIGTSGFIGELFMRGLKMIIVPLIVTSVVAGIANLQGVKGFGRLGLKTAGFYLLSTFLAVLLGLSLVNVIKPGLVDGRPNATIREAFSQSSSHVDAGLAGKVVEAGQREMGDFLGVFRAMLPENVIAAAMDNGQMLGVITFSILFAVALTRIPGDEMQTVRNFFQAANDAMIILTRWIMTVAPIGVFALILPIIITTGAGLFANLGKYFLTVIFALLIHVAIVLPFLLRWLGRVNPIAHFKSMRPALLLAFSTASSSGTLPVTMRCIEHGAGVSKRVTSFTLPLGATVNMDGTALYECVAVMFVAQVMGVEMGIGAQFFVVVAALLTSIGVAGVPSASLVAILLILKSSKIPGAEAAVVALLAVDRPLDMLRTAVNVFSDSCAAVVVARSEGETLGLESKA